MNVLAAGSTSLGAGKGEVEFLGTTLLIPETLVKNEWPSEKDLHHIEAFSAEIRREARELVTRMQALKEDKQLCDWLYYQLIRKVAGTIAPKKATYFWYTIAKWQLLKASGYDPLLLISGNKILLYVRTEDVVYNIPVKLVEGRQYVCLNIHDYGFSTEMGGPQAQLISIAEKESTQAFSFQVDRLPAFPETNYSPTTLEFRIGNKKEKLDLAINHYIREIFTNYPVTEYSNQFNIPLSPMTRSTLIESLQKRLQHRTREEGVTYLMHFVGNAFHFETDAALFGREKRLSPEETLLYGKSDCEDRAALFFYLVREIYDLPMIILSYADHVTVAVNMEKKKKGSVVYNGIAYTICEPTPQGKDLKPGDIIKGMHDRPYTVTFSHLPKQDNRSPE